jgi:protease IV
MSGCLIATLVVLGLAVGLGIVGMIASMLVPSRHASAVRWTSGSGQVAVLSLSGIIQEEDAGGGLFSMGGASSRAVTELVREAAKDDSIKAVVLRINSPGGSAAASQAIFAEVMKLREKKPVVAQMGDVAASGGYYVAAACTAIVAAPATMTGSIGVIMAGTNYSGLARKYGVTDNTITSGKYKDTGSGMRPMRPDERELMQAMVDEVYGQFAADVARGRKMPLDKVRKLADGRAYAGSQAKRVGLVDELGSYHDALALAAAKAGLKGEPTVRKLQSSGSLYDWLRETSLAGQQLALQRAALPFGTTGPGLWMVVPDQGEVEAR